MERLTQILSVLTSAHGGAVAADDLLQVVPYGGVTPENRRDQLRRDLGHLEDLGWAISNVAAEGEMARYRLSAVDNRLRVEFTPLQRAELLRAASAASLAELFDDLGAKPSDEPEGAVPEIRVHAEREPSDLGRVQRAVAGHCLLRFEYRGTPRCVHPHALHVKPGGWYLTANEDGHSQAKTFVVSRMRDVSVDDPGTAVVPDEPARPQLDPISWSIDPVVDVTVRTTGEHREQVEAMLGRATTAETDARAGIGIDAGTDTDVATGSSEAGTEIVTLTIPVTHRAAFRRRVYELGTRVMVTGPPDVRDEMAQELLAVVRGDD
jgi:predicted DNA-binding transcriptional regulator YafY